MNELIKWVLQLKQINNVARMYIKTIHIFIYKVKVSLKVKLSKNAM